MSVAYHHALLAATAPVVLLHYSAATLALGAGSSVSSWPNLGRLGRAYDLAPTGPNAATYAVAGGGAPAHVRFASGEHLVTSLDLPERLSAGAARTVLLRYLVEAGGNVNLLGTGSEEPAKLFDLMTYNGGMLAPHYYGYQVFAPAANLNQYATIALRVRPAGGVASQQLSVLLNGALTASESVALATAAAPLHLGGGAYPFYNQAVPRRIVAAKIVAGALTDSQIARQFLTLF
jgi:hypothetical protein